MIKAAILFDKNNNWLKDYFVSFKPSRTDVIVDFFESASKINNYDVVFVLGYMSILPKEFITKNKITLVVHESDLPNGKGFSPIQWQILEGKSEIIVSLIEMAEEVDSGPIINQTKIVFDGTELYDEIRFLQGTATLELVENFFNSYPDFKRRSQVGESSFYRKRTESDGELDVDLSIRENFNLLRIGNNTEWPSFFMHGNIKYLVKIYKAKD